LALAVRIRSFTDPSAGGRLGFRLQLDRESLCGSLPCCVVRTLTVVWFRGSLQFTFLVVEITPVSIKSIGHFTYVYFCIFNACFVPLIYFFYPETANLELEDVDLLFNGEKVLLRLPRVSVDGFS